VEVEVDAGAVALEVEEEVVAVDLANPRGRKSSLMTKYRLFYFLNGLWFHHFSELLDIPESVIDIYLTVNGHFSPLFRPLKPFPPICARRARLTSSAQVLHASTECPECKPAPLTLISLLAFPKE